MQRYLFSVNAETTKAAAEGMGRSPGILGGGISREGDNEEEDGMEGSGIGWSMGVCVDEDGLSTVEG
jgi:hypothetical protein